MSKSKGNFFTIPDVLARGPPARRHALPAAARPTTAAAELHLGGPGAGGGGPGARPRPRAAAGRGGPATGPPAPRSSEAVRARRAAFDAALADDLNTPEALAAVHGLVARGQRAAGRRARDARGRRARLRAQLETMDSVFGVLLPAAGRTASRPRSRPSSTSARRPGRARVRPRRRGARAGWRRWASSSRTRRRGRGGGESGEGICSAACAAGARPGQAGETLACRHLGARGYAVLARNFRCRSGEVDVVARDGDDHGLRRGQGARGGSARRGHEAVTFGKRRRIVRAARLYAAARGLERDAAALRRGLDRLGGRGRPRIRHDAGRLRLRRPLVNKATARARTGSARRPGGGPRA